MKRRAFLALPAALPLAAQSEPPVRPDLGDLLASIPSMSDGETPTLSFLRPEWKSLPEWKLAARPAALDRFAYNPKPLPLRAVELGREERDGLRIERFRLTAAGTYEIPLWIVAPLGLRGRAPGIVAAHCHSGRYVWGQEKVLSSRADSAPLREFRGEAYGRPYAEALAKRGFVVAVIDAFYFGSRRLVVESLDPATAASKLREYLKPLRTLKPETPEWLAAVNRACSEYEALTAKTIFSAGFTWPGILAWDDRRTVDYLCSRPDVDPNRIGALGLSIGGLRTAHLIATDPRVKAACVTGWMTEFRAQLRNHLKSHTWMAYIPGLYRTLDLPDLAALTAPGALLV
jgi:hypothetical protein